MKSHRGRITNKKAFRVAARRYLQVRAEELKNLEEKRAALVEEMEGILNKAQEEERAFEESEQARFDEIEKEINAIDKTIEAKERARNLGNPGGKKKEDGENDDLTVEERAFVDYVRGTLTNERAANLTYADNGAVIPSSIVNKIIEKVVEICPIYSMDSVVYLGDGTWDLIEEFGSDFFNNATGGGAPRSPVRGLLLKNRIHIIGSSKSKIICNYTGDNAVIKKWFSVFNSDIYGFTLENITIEASNIRYIIHDERDSDTDSYINRYINCHFKFDNSDNDTPGRTAQCIGGGLGIDGYIDINGGVFESIDTTKTGHICVVSYHNSAGANAKNHISIKNTYLKALGYFRINSYGESTKITECEITNCSMGRSVLIGHETGGSNMNINVTQWNNEIR